MSVLLEDYLPVVKYEGLNTNKPVTFGSSSTIGFFGTTAQSQQSGLTQLTATAPGTADYALQDVTNTSPYGFADAEEARTFIDVVVKMQAALKAYGLIS